MGQLPKIGEMIGKYRLDALLGEGAVAWVFRAHDAGLDISRALKILRPEFNTDAEVVARFRDEARALARLRHPNIVPVHEVGQAGACNYMAMEYLPGQTLRRLMGTGRPMEASRVIHLLRQVAVALDWLHTHPTPHVHRDVKPENIMVSPDGHATLLDFGLVKVGAASGLTRQGTIMGTVLYMSPEQVRGRKDITSASDIWSLGVVAFEMLTGRSPFAVDNGMAAAVMHRIASNEKIPSTGMGADVDKVLRRALAQDARQRWPSAQDFVDALDRALKRGNSSPKPPWWILAVGAIVVLFMTVRANDGGAGSDQPVPTKTAPTAASAAIATRTPSATPEKEATSTSTQGPTDTPPTPPPTLPPSPSGTPLPPPAAISTRPATRVPPTTGPTSPPPTQSVTESIVFWQDGPALSAETLCTSISWSTAGFVSVYVWLEQGEADRGAPKPAIGRETNLCGIQPGDKATFNLAAVRADGSEERKVLVIRNEGDD